MDIPTEAMGALFSQLMIDEEWSTRRERGFSWVAHRLRQDFDAVGPFESMGMLVTRVACSTPVVERVRRSDDKVLGVLAGLNMLSVGEALVWDRATRSVRCCCSTLLHRETLPWRIQQLGAFSIIALAVWEARARLLAKVLKGSVAEWRHPKGGRRRDRDDMLNVIGGVFHPAGKEPSRFADETEFVQLHAWLRTTPNFCAGGDAGGIAIEVPRDNADTSLIQLRTDQEHPTLGSGLLCTIKMRMGDGVGVASLSAHLNTIESGGGFVGPAYGAWCVDSADPAKLLSHAQFIPNRLYQRGVIRDVAMTAIRRAQWASEVIHREPVPTYATVRSNGGWRRVQEWLGRS